MSRGVRELLAAWRRQVDEQRSAAVAGAGTPDAEAAAGEWLAACETQLIGTLRLAVSKIAPVECGTAASSGPSGVDLVRSELADLPSLLHALTEWPAVRRRPLLLEAVTEAVATYALPLRSGVLRGAVGGAVVRRMRKFASEALCRLLSGDFRESRVAAMAAGAPSALAIAGGSARSLLCAAGFSRVEVDEAVRDEAMASLAHVINAGGMSRGELRLTSAVAAPLFLPISHGSTQVCWNRQGRSLVAALITAAGCGGLPFRVRATATHIDGAVGGAGGNPSDSRTVIDAVNDALHPSFVAAVLAEHPATGLRMVDVLSPVPSLLFFIDRPAAWRAEIRALWSFAARWPTSSVFRSQLPAFLREGRSGEAARSRAVALRSPDLWLIAQQELVPLLFGLHHAAARRTLQCLTEALEDMMASPLEDYPAWWSKAALRFDGGSALLSFPPAHAYFIHGGVLHRVVAALRSVSAEELRTAASVVESASVELSAALAEVSLPSDWADERAGVDVKDVWAVVVQYPAWQDWCLSQMVAPASVEGARVSVRRRAVALFSWMTYPTESFAAVLRDGWEEDAASAAPKLPIHSFEDACRLASFISLGVSRALSSGASALCGVLGDGEHAATWGHETGRDVLRGTLVWLLRADKHDSGACAEAVTAKLISGAYDALQQGGTADDSLVGRLTAERVAQLCDVLDSAAQFATSVDAARAACDVARVCATEMRVDEPVDETRPAEPGAGSGLPLECVRRVARQLSKPEALHPDLARPLLSRLEAALTAADAPAGDGTTE